MRGVAVNSKCACPSCERDKPHQPDKCRRNAVWYLKIHALDTCLSGAARELSVCNACFEQHIKWAKDVITWGMAGFRYTVCDDCTRPLVRLSALVEDVGKL